MKVFGGSLSRPCIFNTHPRFFIRCRTAFVTVVIPLVLFQFSATPAVADFEAGLTAYQTGDYQQSFEQWSRAANAGDGNAQYRLGTLYEDGVGTQQDLVQAWMWYEIASKSDIQFASDSRDSTAQRLTAGELAEAQRLADSFVPSVSSPPARQPAELASGRLTQQVQAELNRLGFAVGEQDGVPGPQTRDAIAQFQRSTGTVADGQVSEALLAQLKQTLSQSKEALEDATIAINDAAASETTVPNRSIGDGDGIESGSVEAVPAATEEVASSPATTESVASPSAEPATTPSNPDDISIAIFPLENLADDGFFGDVICEEVVAALKPRQFAHFRLSHASVPCSNQSAVDSLPEGLRSKAGIKQLWKGSLFGAKPIAETVAQQGRELGVDIVMLFLVKESLSWENPGAVELLVQRIYVFDTADATQWSLAGSPSVTIQGDVRTEIPQITRALLTKYQTWKDL